MISIQMLVMIALGHVYAKTRLHKARLNQMSKIKSLFTIHHILTASKTIWPTIEKEAFAIFYALQKLDQYLHDSECVSQQTINL